MLTIFRNNTPDGINKGLEFAPTLTKEDFELFFANEDIDIIFYFSLLFLLAIQGGIFEESGGK